MIFLRIVVRCLLLIYHEFFFALFFRLTREFELHGSKQGVSKEEYFFVFIKNTANFLYKHVIKIHPLRLKVDHLKTNYLLTQFYKISFFSDIL